MRSTFAAVLALALLALGPTAGVARADETAEPTASAKASEPDKPAKEDDADSDKSDDADKSEKPDAKESEAPKPSQTPKATATAKPSEKSEPSEKSSEKPKPSRTPSAPAARAVSPAAAEECAATASVEVAASVRLGGKLRVTGAGFCHPTDGGSRVAIKIDEGAYSRLDTALHLNKTIWAIVDAAADGTFSEELQLPDGTTAGANGSDPALPLGGHTLRLLTGSLKTGDTSRTLQSAVFQVTDATAPEPEPTTATPEPSPTTASPTPTPTTASPTPTPTTASPTPTPSPTTASPTPTTSPTATPTTEPPTPTPTPTTASPSPTPTTTTPTTPPTPGDITYTDPKNPSVTYTVPTTVKRGEPIVVSGTGWLAPTGVGAGGSVLGVLLDAAMSGDPNTVYTKRDVINPLTNQVHGDKRQQAIVQAAPDGSWTATIPFPTADNARLADNSWTEWAIGSSHQIRFLTGSLLTGDTARSLAANFTVTGTDPLDPETLPPTWAHTTVSAGGATAWVQSEVSTASGSKLKIKGINWRNQAGTGASTVALKLNRTGGQYVRTGSGIVAPNGTPDATIWKLLAPAGTPAHPNVVILPASGNFEIEIDAPEGLVAGQLLTAQFLSGRFGANDTVRNVTTAPLVVGGVPYVEVPDDADVTCKPTTSTPVVNIENAQVGLGGTLHVTGTGFCHPGEKRGGSTIAIKIDEGAYSRLTDSLHSNRTIWAIVQAKASDGTFDVQLQLPNGTTAGANGSTPAFPTGSHSLRLLTGSLKEGDTSRTLQSSSFVVGSYRPNGVPDPVEATEDLTDATRNGVTLSLKSSTLQVTVPGAKEGDWIYLNAYSDGSPRDTWGQTWFTADAQGRVKASVKNLTLPVGASKVSVQSGNEGQFGTLLGWAPLSVAAPKPPAAAPPPPAPRAPAPAPVTAAQEEDSAPTTVPDAPAERSSQLTGVSNGDATGKAEGTKITVTLPKGKADQWVYLYLYHGATVTNAGWVKLDDAKAFVVDLKDLPDGRHRIVAVNEDGDVLGWVDATKGKTSATVVTGAAPVAAAVPAAPEAAPPAQPGGGSLEPVLIGAAIAVLTAGAFGLRRLALKPKQVP